MATPITEDPNSYPADDSIVSPDGTDLRVNASAVVRAFVQMLTDRTAWLRQRITRLDADNTLAGNNTFLRPVNGAPNAVNDPVLVCTQTAVEGPNPSGNRWQHIARLKSGGGQYVHIYTGYEGNTRGGFAVTYNAHWDANAGTAGQWIQYDSGRASTALVWRYDSVSVHTVDTDTDPWEFWPSPTNSGEMSAQALIGETVYVDAVEWRTPVSRQQAIPIASFKGDGRLETDGTVSLLAGSALDPAWPLVLPPGWRFGTILISHLQNQSDVGDTFELWRRSGSSAWNQTFATKVAGTGSTDATTTLHDTADIAANGELVQPDYEYMIVWRVTSGDPAATNNRIKRLSVSRLDTGLAP